MAHEAGKGDTYRKIDLEAYEQNFEKIFGVKNKPLSRIDVISSNGNEGLHYEYELDKSTGEVIKKC
ncbi:hypothetical protein UFOVP96_40 [uncultured Caudovirales phage]|uniref:Uncharacterized protein n=1 Tax=uncultured Caudovirales phage TaxID=2100421 RepID=A0A6J5L0G4_9CAUD|nr:hypothetical protein UFOVP96_40 [uncultured Caudovirales phage]